LASSSVCQGVAGLPRPYGHYRRFIHNYGVIAAPLTDFLKREAFLWSSAATEAFDALKVVDSFLWSSAAFLWSSAGTAGNDWSVVDDFVLHQGKIFVPVSSTFWPQLLEHAHGVQKTIVRLRSSFYSPQMSKHVREFIRWCLVCQRNKTEHLHPGGLLQPLDVPSMVWSDITMDFVEGFPKVGGKSVVLTVVDRFS